MRPIDALLIDIVSAADRMASYVAGMSRTEFLADNKTKAAVVREIEIIGEAANRIPTLFWDAHPDVPWARMAQLRNLYIHVYERISYERVWTTATHTMPAIVTLIRSLVPPDPGTT